MNKRLAVLIFISMACLLVGSCKLTEAPAAAPTANTDISPTASPANAAQTPVPTSSLKPNTTLFPTGTASPDFAIPTATPAKTVTPASPFVQQPNPVIPSDNPKRDADLKYLYDTVPEIEMHRKEMIKLNPDYKQVVRDLSAMNSKNSGDKADQLFLVEEARSTHHVAWNTFMVKNDHSAILVLDSSTGNYITLSEWRTGKPTTLKSWDVRLANHIYEVTVSIDDQMSLHLEANEGGKLYKLNREAFGAASTLEVNSLESSAGTKTIIITAASSESGTGLNTTVLALDTKSDQPALTPNPFRTLNATRLYDFVSLIKDSSLKEWVTGKYMGYRMGLFQSFTATGIDKGTVIYTVGSNPTLVTGKAEVKYDAAEQLFKLVSITSASFEDPLASASCKNIVRVQDPEFGEILAWSETKSAYRFAAINANYLAQAAACGESLDKPLKNGSSYLIETIVRYADKPELLKYLLDNWKLTTNIRDKNGITAYAIALSVGVNDPLLLDPLRAGITKAQSDAEGQSVLLSLHGSKVSLESIKLMVKNGISVNKNMSAYAYLLSQKDPDYMTGTILGSAILNNDYEKAKWLLDNGADPNMLFGSGEYSRSPLRAALTKDLKMAELLLQHNANPDEVYSVFPVKLSVLAGNRCFPDKVALLKKYGANKWVLSDPDPAMKTDYKTEEEIMKLACK